MEMEFGREALDNLINMKVLTQMIKNVDMGFLLGPAEIFTKENILMMYDMVTEKCIGVMEAAIKGTGKKEYSMDKVIIL